MWGDGSSGVSCISARVASRMPYRQPFFLDYLFEDVCIARSLGRQRACLPLNPVAALLYSLVIVLTNLIKIMSSLRRKIRQGLQPIISVQVDFPKHRVPLP